MRYLILTLCLALLVACEPIPTSTPTPTIEAPTASSTALPNPTQTATSAATFELGNPTPTQEVWGTAEPTACSLGHDALPHFTLINSNRNQLGTLTPSIRAFFDPDGTQRIYAVPTGYAPLNQPREGAHATMHERGASGYELTLAYVAGDFGLSTNLQLCAGTRYLVALRVPSVVYLAGDARRLSDTPLCFRVNSAQNRCGGLVARPDGIYEALFVFELGGNTGQVRNTTIDVYFSPAWGVTNRKIMLSQIRVETLPDGYGDDVVVFVE